MKKHLVLIKKYLDTTISSEERKELIQWVAEKEEHKNIFKAEIYNWSRVKEEVSVDTGKAYNRFMRTIAKKEKKETKVYKLHILKKGLKYAAILVGVCLMTYYFTQSIGVISPDHIELVDNHLTSLEDKIQIVQEDGTVTYIDAKEQSDVFTPDGTIIGTQKEDEFIIASADNHTLLEYLEISIPKGEIFQLRLQDGTKVWLNAASKLKFPKQFNTSENNRVVYLEGEAFFDVTTNKEKPFIVKTKGIDVEVLGTQFNVSSYTNDPTIYTTLIEGSVALNATSNSKKITTLVPNDQVVFTKMNNSYKKRKVDTHVYTAWMNRKMIIENESFASVIHKLERAYNVTIASNNEQLNNTRFTGEFDVENIQQILDICSQTLDFSYTIKNKRIVITH